MVFPAATAAARCLSYSRKEMREGIRHQNGENREKEEVVFSFYPGGIVITASPTSTWTKLLIRITTSLTLGNYPLSSCNYIVAKVLHPSCGWSSCCDVNDVLT